jgi:hypothetical protein
MSVAQTGIAASYFCRLLRISPIRVANIERNCDLIVSLCGSGITKGSVVGLSVEIIVSD